MEGAAAMYALHSGMSPSRHAPHDGADADTAVPDDDRRRLVRGLGWWAGAAVAARVGAGGAVVVAVAGGSARRASAQQTLDVEILQTAASLENLLIDAYESMLGVTPVMESNPGLRQFAEATVAHHREHVQIYNEQVQALEGAVQEAAHPGFRALVDEALPGISTAADVIELAVRLEQIVTDTFVANMALLEDTTALDSTASIMGVEAQHLSMLRAVGALLGAGMPALEAAPVDAASLAVGVIDAALPEIFSLPDRDNIAPPESGAVG